MASTTVIKAKNPRRVFSKILGRLLRGTSYTTRADGQLGSMRLRRWQKRVWVSTGDPTAESTTSGANPITKGDLVYREDSDEAFICQVACEAATAGTFIQMHA